MWWCDYGNDDDGGDDDLQASFQWKAVCMTAPNMWR